MGGGQPTAITPSEAHVGKEFDILNVPTVHGKFDSVAILESGGPGNEWYKRSAILENTQ